MDWKPMLNWILQGVIVAVCAFAGVYLALWLFARQRHETAPLPEPVSGTGRPETWVEPPALAASSVMATCGDNCAFPLLLLPPSRRTCQRELLCSEYTHICGYGR